VAYSHERLLHEQLDAAAGYRGAAVGYKLPGLEFNNQKVEAAYRKELVFGEDSAERAQPMQITELYSSVRKNYFKLYFNYLYFNVFRYAYLQGANFVPLVAMAPTIVAGAITFGTFQTNALAPIKQLRPMRAPLSTTAPIPIKLPSPTVHPCNIA